MKVTIDQDQRVRVIEADDLKALSVACGALADADIHVALEKAKAGEVREEHAVLSIDWLRSKGSTLVEWNKAFDAMIAFAGKKGWVDEEAGTVRAHLERG